MSNRAAGLGFAIPAESAHSFATIELVGSIALRNAGPEVLIQNPTDIQKVAGLGFAIPTESAHSSAAIEIVVSIALRNAGQ